MRNAGAIMVAAELLRRPTLVRAVRDAPLPKGMTLLLEVAAGDAEAIDRARVATGDSPERLVEAACFFVEQILLTHRADHYRVLGSSPATSTADLRRHMALLMRWMHPDIKNTGLKSGQVDRTVFVARVTTAWQALKTGERRAAYDVSLQNTVVHLRSGRHSHRSRLSRSGLLLRSSETGALAKFLMWMLRVVR